MRLFLFCECVGGGVCFSFVSVLGGGGVGNEMYHVSYSLVLS